jgi:hypothetical protein
MPSGVRHTPEAAEASDTLDLSGSDPFCLPPIIVLAEVDLSVLCGLLDKLIVAMLGRMCNRPAQIVGSPVTGNHLFAETCRTEGGPVSY